MTNETKKLSAGDRWVAADKWVSAKNLPQHKSFALWGLCEELRVLGRAIASDSLSIAQSATQFAERLVEFGATHSAPCAMNRYSELASKIACLESKISAVFAVEVAVMGDGAVDELRSVIGAE